MQFPTNRLYIERRENRQSRFPLQISSARFPLDSITAGNKRTRINLKWVVRNPGINRIARLVSDHYITFTSQYTHLRRFFSGYCSRCYGTQSQAVTLKEVTTVREDKSLSLTGHDGFFEVQQRVLPRL